MTNGEEESSTETESPYGKRFYQEPVWVPVNIKHSFTLRKVFTIFCHGTGGHRDGVCKELITEFGRVAAGEYQKDYLILDGPGPSDMFKNEEGDKVGVPEPPHPHPMPGDYEPETLDKPFKPMDKRLSGHSKWNPLLGGFVGKIKGAAGGEGWNDNVKHAIFVLKELEKENRLPDVINMIGWSRGAITCIKISNAIQLQWPRKDIELNLFPIDPVPGLAGIDLLEAKREEIPEKHSDTYTLPPKIKNMIVTLAMDEQRKGFFPVDMDKVQYEIPDEKPNQNVVFLPFPGIHRAQLRMEPRDPTDDYNDPPVRHLMKSVPHIVWDLSWRFLMHFGTNFKVNLLKAEKFGKGPLNNKGILELYTDTMNRRAEYHQGRNRGMGQRAMGGLAPRKFTGMNFDDGNLNINTHPKNKLFTSALAKYVKEYEYFINEHHRLIFEKTYPAVYDYFFGSNGSTKEEVEAELKKIKDEAPLTRKSLERHGMQVTAADGETTYGEPFSGKKQKVAGIGITDNGKNLEKIGFVTPPGDGEPEDAHGVEFKPTEFPVEVWFEKSGTKTPATPYHPRLYVTGDQQPGKKEIFLETKPGKHREWVCPEIKWKVGASDQELRSKVRKATLSLETENGESVFRKHFKNKGGNFEITHEKTVDWSPYKGRGKRGWASEEFLAETGDDPNVSKKPLVLSLALEPKDNYVIYDSDPKLGWTYLYVKKVP